MKRDLHKSIILFIITNSILYLSSCSPILKVIYGFKKLDNINNETIIQYSEKYKIPIEDSYKLDTSYYSFLYSYDTVVYKSQIKNHLQPLQALYYTNKGNLESYQINCFAGGFPNLKWNRNNVLSVFPPLQQAPIDSLIPLDIHMKHIKSINNNQTTIKNDYDYIVIVYWSKFMGRQSKRFVNFIQENYKLSKGNNVKFLYVNTDNLYYENLEF